MRFAITAKCRKPPSFLPHPYSSCHPSLHHIITPNKFTQHPVWTDLDKMKEAFTQHSGACLFINLTNLSTSSLKADLRFQAALKRNWDRADNRNKASVQRHHTSGPSHKRLRTIQHCLYKLEIHKHYLPLKWGNKKRHKAMK